MPFLDVYWPSYLPYAVLALPALLQTWMSAPPALGHAGADQALQRRLNFRVRFPEPEVDERAALWQKLLPPATGLVEAPFDRLAERFEMTGGYIKNAIVRAAVIAAREERTLTVDDLWTGAHAEYAEMGKVLSTHTRT